MAPHSGHKPYKDLLSGVLMYRKMASHSIKLISNPKTNNPNQQPQPAASTSNLNQQPQPAASTSNLNQQPQPATSTSNLHL